MENNLFETYKYYLMPHGKHIFKTAYEMAIAVICAYTSSTYALPHWTFTLRCCT